MRIIKGSEIPFSPASHEDPANPGVLKRVLLARGELLSEPVQMLNWAWLPAGNAFQRHYHEDMQEIFIIVRGTVQMVVEEARFQLSEGDCVMIDPGERHLMRNETGEDAFYVVVGLSPGLGGRTVVI